MNQTCVCIHSQKKKTKLEEAQFKSQKRFIIIVGKTAEIFDWMDVVAKFFSPCTFVFLLQTWRRIETPEPGRGEYGHEIRKLIGVFPK